MYAWKIYIVSVLNAKDEIKKEIGVRRLGFYRGCSRKEGREGGKEKGREIRVHK